MALGGISAGWNNNTPGANDQAGNGDDEIRSLKSNLQGALNSEHYFPAAGDSANVGVHLPGSARAFYGAESLVSSQGTDGRLFVSSNRSRLFHVGSNGTMFLGSALAISLSSGVNLQTPAQTHAMFLEDWQGNTTALSNGSVAVTFSSAFSGTPLSLVVNAEDSSNFWNAVPAGNSKVSIYGYSYTGARVAGTAFFRGFSIGSRVLG